MRWRPLALVLFLSVFVGKTAFSQHSTPPSVQEARTIFTSYFSSLTHLGKFNGVLLVRKQDSLVVHQAWNQIDDSTNCLMVTKDHRFDIHSVSKLMAAYLVEKLEEEEKLSKSDFLTSWFSEFPHGNEITLEMLLNHSSGLPRELSNYSGDLLDLSEEEVVELAGQEKLEFSPGSASQYSNVAYQLIYFIIGQEYGMTFEEALYRQVFEPAQMGNSGAHFNFVTQSELPMALNHTLGDSAPQLVENIQEDEFRHARVFSTASDLDAFLSFLCGSSVVENLKNKDGIIEKNGGSAGIRAQVYADPESGWQFVLLANYDGMPFQQTVLDMIRITKGEPVEVPQKLNRKPIQLSDDLFVKWEGVYVFPDFGGLELKFQFNPDSRKLEVFQEGELISELLPEAENIFFEDPSEPESFEFFGEDGLETHCLMGWRGVKVKGIRE